MRQTYLVMSQYVVWVREAGGTRRSVVLSDLQQERGQAARPNWARPSCAATLSAIAMYRPVEDRHIRAT